MLRLHDEAGLSHRAIAQACAIGLGTVTTYWQRATAAGVTWPVPDDLDDVALEARVFARPAPVPGRDRHLPDWPARPQEVKQPGVTLMLLWQAYRATHPTGDAYSQFCERYRQWARGLKPSMRQVHRAGEKLFVDVSGTRPHLVDARTGEQIPVELFVGVLGASGLIDAEAPASQNLPSWISAPVRMVEYFQGGAAVWVPDHLKSGVTIASRYDPAINRRYAELAHHAGAVVIPARVGTPPDKPKVEVSVPIAQRGVLAAFRHRTFFTLADLNAAIRARLDAINDRPLNVVGLSRRALWDQIDRPALKPLPTTRDELAEWKACRGKIDDHVEIDHHFDSVPAPLVHQRVEARVTASAVEVFLAGRRVAAHARVTGRGRFVTDLAHMPRAPRAHAEWPPSRLIAGADQRGPATGRFVAGLLERRPHPEQGYRACLGLMRLGRLPGADRLEAACLRAERLQSYRYRTVEHMLTYQQDRLPLDAPAPARPALTHENLRGATFDEEVYADAPDDRETPRAASAGDGDRV